MTWQLWIVVAFNLVSAVTTPTMVGKDRKPLDGTTAAMLVGLNLVVAFLIVWGA